jgi:hypothetical protein
MIFTFNFGATLDFAQFRAQATRYLSVFKEITYHLNLFNYKLVCCTTKQDFKYETNFHIVQIERDIDGAIVNGNILVPLSDSKFKDLKEISSNFSPDSYMGTSEQLNIEQVVNFYCKLLKFLNKIDTLSVFV